MSAQTLRRPLVLIVDDDPDVVGSLAVWLGHRFDVVTAEDGLGALQVLAEHRVDVIVLDLMMPNMDGASFKRALDTLGVSVPVILASAASDVDGSAKALGIRDYLVKPIDLDRLEAMIDRLVRSGPGGGPVPGGTQGTARGGSGGMGSGQRGRACTALGCLSGPAMAQAGAPLPA